MLESVDLRPRLRKALCASGGAAGAAGGAEVRALAAAERSVSGCKLLCQVLAATTDAKAIDAKVEKFKESFWKALVYASFCGLG